MRHVLVTGSKGQLGTELLRLAWPADWRLTGIDVAELDLTDSTAIANKLAESRWDAVINAAAYTAVDRAESDVARAWAVNALAPAALAQSCVAADIPIIQVSTDYVFDGLKEGEWEPDDTPNPLSVYGASKLGGELAVRTGCRRYAVVRTSWLISAHGTNFLKTMLRLGAERKQVRVVDDQWGAPTSAADLAAALATMTTRLVADPETPSGVWHFSNSGRASWFEVAKRIFEEVSAHGNPSPEVEAIPTSEYQTPVTRPRNSVLSHAAINDSFGIVPRPWETALDDILDELIG